MKIFLGDKTIVLTDRPLVSNPKNDRVVSFHSRKQLKKLFDEFAENETAANLIIYSESYDSTKLPGVENTKHLFPGNPDKELLSSFLTLFKIIEAAGGLVKNEQDELLFIFRRGKWDLPKGKIDVHRSMNINRLSGRTIGFQSGSTALEHKGQSKLKESYDNAAIREVKEETGLHDVMITSELATTYHVYMQRGEWILKPTVWFEMYAANDQALVPEEKEDITEARWLRRDEMEIIKKNTYASIRELLLIEFPRIDLPEI